MIRSVIKGTGHSVPSRLVTNEDLARWMDTSDEWIRQRTGIEQRYWVPEEGGVGTSDLGLEASKIALDRAGWKPEDIDLIIFATLSPDIFFPGAGCFLQHKLGLDTTPALDIRQQCTGFHYGMATVDAYIRSGMARRVLFVGGEVHSTGLDISDKGRDISVIFGDGAGALCLEAVETDEKVGILSCILHAQGKYAESLSTHAPASKDNPRLTHEMLDQGQQFPVMEGRNIFKQALIRLPEVAKETLDAAGLTIADVDLVIPHQANLRINQGFQKAMGLPDEKVYNNIHKYGNTTAASIPIALDDAIAEKRLVSGSLALFIGLGSGLTWGGVAYRFP